MPGGVIELDESPKSALIREVKEELNLQLGSDNIKFLLIDYMAGNGDITEALMFVFSGGLVSEEKRKSIRLPKDELKSYKFADKFEAAALLGTNLGDRLLRAIEAQKSGSFSYFEGQY